VCDVPTAVVNLIDADRQWPAAAHGWQPTEVPRCDSMCAVSIESHDVSYTPDAAHDRRWAGNPFTTGELAAVRLYAAAPLVMPRGEVVGTICVFSEESQPLQEGQLERLRDLADLAVQLLDLHRAAEHYEDAALRDSLTGLPNRALFAVSLEQALALAARGRSFPAVLFLDVDGFKSINDTHGHAAGDDVLREIGRRLLDSVRGSDVVARLGGDEFVLLCEGAPDEPVALDVLQTRLRERLAPPIVLTSAPGRPAVSVRVSIGGASAAEDGSYDDILVRADAAMYRDKDAAR
jgi:diguanylate cyclase (GGDEF)-like protein